MHKTLLTQLNQFKSYGRKAFAVLLDPDYISRNDLGPFLTRAEACEVDMLLLGGSLMVDGDIDEALRQLKSQTDIPVVLFPGSIQQISSEADAILLLSLISGRNPELLIGQHVIAAPKLKKSGLEILPTGYMLIESGRTTTAHYVSNSLPIPYEKAEIAACTAMAGEMLGLKLIYMDGGSGAEKSISSEMIAAVSKQVDLPLIIGGGIRSAEDASRIWDAGADMIVIGNALEKGESFELLEAVASCKSGKNQKKAI